MNKAAIRLLLTIACLALSTTVLLAQAYPSRAIRIVVPYPAGGPTDILARLVGDRLSRSLNQTVVIENKPGASSMIGMDSVARSTPDGYTILVNASLHVIVPSIADKVLVDPIDGFEAVTQLGTVPLIMVVNQDSPAKTAADIVAEAKANPGKLTYGSSGVGASSHLAGAMLMKMAGLQMIHVPYKGSAPALQDVLTKNISFMIDTTPASIGLVQSGSLKAIGVSAPSRLSVLPDVPTISESGVPGYNVQSWYGVWMPRGTPKEIVTKISREIAEIVKLPDVRERLKTLGAEPTTSTPEEFAAFTVSEMKRWSELVKETGAKAQ
ncbi:MAG TPA: tripartite tricarboxylate transporter substrate binding protein [Xanthobacteraceae bacterium]|nr:tripartite tricarboxylate transporter substrate binding protein [Xanthobacteraceae bacterium]